MSHEARLPERDCRLDGDLRCKVSVVASETLKSVLPDIEWTLGAGDIPVTRMDSNLYQFNFPATHGSIQILGKESGRYHMAMRIPHGDSDSGLASYTHQSDDPNELVSIMAQILYAYHPDTYSVVVKDVRPFLIPMRTPIGEFHGHETGKGLCSYQKGVEGALLTLLRTSDAYNLFIQMPDEDCFDTNISRFGKSIAHRRTLEDVFMEFQHWCRARLVDLESASRRIAVYSACLKQESTNGQSWFERI